MEYGYDKRCGVGCGYVCRCVALWGRVWHCVGICVLKWVEDTGMWRTRVGFGELCLSVGLRQVESVDAVCKDGRTQGGGCYGGERWV